MLWIIFALVIWLVLLIFLRANLVKYWSAGLWTFLVVFFIHSFFIKHEFYYFKEMLYPVQGIPAIFLFGMIGVGIIIVSLLPVGKIWQLPYLIFCSLLLTGLEMLATGQGYLMHTRWTLGDSFSFMLFELIAITWLSNLTVKRRRSGFFMNRGIY